MVAERKRPLSLTSRAASSTPVVRVLPLAKVKAGLVITGSEVYSRLRFESGVHRVQRVPATEGGARAQGGVVHAADFLKNAQATLDHQPKLPAGATGNAQRQRRALQHQVARLIAETGHHCPATLLNVGRSST